MKEEKSSKISKRISARAAALLRFTHSNLSLDYAESEEREGKWAEHGLSVISCVSWKKTNVLMHHRLRGSALTMISADRAYFDKIS